MIIECEKCASKFNLDDTLLKTGGSKVRCTVCKHVFVARPPKEMPVDASTKGESPGEGLEETSSLDARTALGEKQSGGVEETTEPDFDLAFEEAMNEAEVEEPASPDQGLEQEGLSTADTEVLDREAAEEDAEPTLPVVVPKAKRRGLRVLLVVLVVIILILAGAAAVYVYAPGLIPDSIPFLKPPEKQEVTDPGVARLSFKADHFYVQSDTAGDLFVIEGRVTNNYPKPRSFIRMKGSIQDDTGKTVKAKEVYAGNTFTEQEIKERSLEELERGFENRFGKGRINVNVPTGVSIPFMIIFEDLPENASVYSVEGVRSTPGE